MKQGMPWSIKGVDTSARDAAKDAARRAGMTLGEWLNTVIAETAAEREARAQAEAEPRLSDASVEERLARLHRAAVDTTARATGVNDLASVLQRAMDQSRQQTEQVEVRTAGALESMMRWIERTDRQRRDELGSLAHAQERTSLALREALTLVTARLDAMERTIETGRDRELTPVRTALQRLENRIDDLGQREADGPIPPKVARTLQQLEQKLVDIAGKLEERSEPRHVAIAPERIEKIEATLSSLVERLAGGKPTALQTLAPPIAPIPAPVAASPLPPAAEQEPVSFDSLLSQIRARQQALLEGSRTGGATAAEAPVEAQFAALREEMSGLARKLDEIHQTRSPELDAMRQDLAELAGTVRGLSPRNDIEALETALREVSLQVEMSRQDAMSRGGFDESLERLSGDIAKLIADIAPLKALGTLRAEIDRLGEKLDRVPDAPATGGALEAMAGEIADLKAMVARSTEAVQAIPPIEAAVAALAAKLDGAGASDLQAVERQIGELAGRMTQLQQSVENRPVGEISGSSLESLVLSLRDKMDDAARPDGGGRSLDALEQQIAAMTSALERSGENFAGLKSLESSIAELFGRIEETRRSTIEAAEFAAQRAAEAALRAAPEPASRPDAPDRRTSLALEGMQDTMERIVERLSLLESDITSDRERLFEVAEQAVKSQAAQESRAAQDSKQATQAQNAAQKIAAAAAAAHAARQSETLRGPDLRDGAGGSESRLPDHRLPPPSVSPADARALAAAARASMLPLTEASSKDDVPPPASAPVESVQPASSDASVVAGSSVLPDDMLLEPGSGRPPVTGVEPEGDESEATAAETNADAAMSNFIASARIAAQSGTGKVGSRTAAKAPRTADAGQSAGATAADDQAASGSKLQKARRFIDQRRRPILLCLAAVVLALSTAQIARNVLGGGQGEPPQGSPAPEGNRQSSVDQPPAEKPVVQVTPAPSMMDPTAQANGGFTRSAPAEQQAQAFTPARPKDPETVGAISDPHTPPAAPQGDQPRMGQVQLADVPVGALPTALTKAAGVGQPAAIYEVANRYFEGRGLPRDAKAAAKWFERAASQGFAPAQYRLGSMYEKGVGVPADTAAAKNWYRQSADRGNAKAMHNLGVLIAEGSGGKPDYEAAAVWFRKAADLGLRDSQYNLAILTARGLGVQQSLAQSYTWFYLAAAQGDEDAARKREEVAARLDAPTLAAAKAAAEAFKPGRLDDSANDTGAPAGGWEAEAQAVPGGKPKKSN